MKFYNALGTFWTPWPIELGVEWKYGTFNAFSNIASATASVLGAFAKLRKVAGSFVVSVRPSVRPPAWNNSAPAARIFMKFYIWVFFENLSRKSKSHYNLTRITDIIGKDLYTYSIISRSVLLRMRNVSGKSCRENQNTHFIFSNFVTQIVPFMR
jgi:hypothetical protein